MSNPSLLCLQWGNHKKALTCRLNDLRSEEIFCDATITCAAKFFPVHRIVLSSCSEYFEEIFKNAPCRHPFIILKDVEASSIEYILDFIYKGDVKIPDDKLQSFLKIAETLKIKGLAVPDIPTSGKITDEISFDTESEDNEELYTAVSREETEAELSATESTTIQYLAPNHVKSDPGKEISFLKKSLDCHINTEEQVSERRQCLRSRKKSKNADEPQLSPDRGKAAPEEKVKQSRKKSPVKVKIPFGSTTSENENEMLKSLAIVAESKMGKKKLDSKKTDKQSAAQEHLNLRECTVTFSGKQEVRDDDDDNQGPPRSKENLPQQLINSQKGMVENVVETTISDSQMKVDVDEFFDDPNDGSRLKFTDDIVPLQYQIPDVHIGGCIDISISGIEGSSTMSMSDEDNDEIPSSSDDSKMVESSQLYPQVNLQLGKIRGNVSDGGSTSTQRANGQSNDEGNTGLPINLIGPLMVEKKPVELEKPFACYICPYRTKYRSALIKHVIVHTGAKPFKCKDCPYETSRKTHLKVHSLTHSTEKPYKCEICSKTFVQKSNYKVHMWVHLQRKPYRCHFCSYASNTSGSLRRHIRIHEGTIPFKCHLCPFGAQASGDLKKHLRTHTGEKPFPCTYCDYKAAVKTTLKRHMATRHKNS